MRFLSLLSIFIFVGFWQYFAFVFLLLIFPIYAIYKENFIFLKARKTIIKKATLIPKTKLYKLTAKNTFLKFIALSIAFFGVLSLALNLMYANTLDFIFLFFIFPVIFILIKLKFNTLFLKTSYNILRLALFSALPTALLYACFALYLRENADSLSYLTSHIDNYKTSNFAPLDTLSKALNIFFVLKNFLLLWGENFIFTFFFFCFDFLNFFILCFAFALLCHFAFYRKINVIFCMIFGVLLLLFYKEQRNEVPIYQEKASILLRNLTSKDLFEEQNLTLLKMQSENYKKNLNTLKELLSKNALEVGIWWFSDEKEELQKSLERLEP